MPVGIASIPVSVFAAIGVPAVVAVIIGPTSPDIYAVVGALFASVLPLLEASANNRTLGHKVSVFIASGVGGSIVPGLALYWKFGHDADALRWNVWAGAGVVSGLMSWSVIFYPLMYFRKRASAGVIAAGETLADRYLPDKAKRDSAELFAGDEQSRIRMERAAQVRTTPQRRD